MISYCRGKKGGTREADLSWAEILWELEVFPMLIAMGELQWGVERNVKACWSFTDGRDADRGVVMGPGTWSCAGDRGG